MDQTDISSLLTGLSDSILAPLLAKKSFRSFLDVVYPEMTTLGFQNEIIECWEQDRYPLVIHSRKLGMTRLCVLYALWLCTTQRNMTIGFMVPNTAVYNDIKENIYNLMKSEYTKLFNFDTEIGNEFYFNNASRIVLLFSHQKATGFSFDYIFCDQMQNFDPQYYQQVHRNIWSNCVGPQILYGSAGIDHGVFYDLVVSKRFYKEDVLEYDYTHNPELVEWLKDNHIDDLLSKEEFNSSFKCQFSEVYGRFQ